MAVNNYFQRTQIFTAKAQIVNLSVDFFNGNCRSARLLSLGRCALYTRSDDKLKSDTRTFSFSVNFTPTRGIYSLDLLDNGEMMKRPVILALVLICLSAVAGFSQTAVAESNIVKKDLSPAELNRIIKKVTENESLFRRALTLYVFDRSATMQTVGMGGQISGTYRRDSFLSFNDAGERSEKIVFFPMSTITDLVITLADIENLGGIDPFAIEPKVADQYQFTYLGKEHVDELDLFVFDVAPKVMPDPKKGIAKFFSGRIWVDDQDLMIVRTKGKAVPEGKERFPIVETTRASVDNKYYFPIDSRSDDTLVFEKGQEQKIRFRVSYKNYRQGRSDVRILDDVPDAKPTPSPTPKKPE